MSAQAKYISEPRSMGCFEVNVEHGLSMPAWLNEWNRQVSQGKFKISQRHEEALARLVPFLLCGEQSAIHVFGSEIERLRSNTLSKSIDLLRSIETDEYAHEQALQTLTSMLMEPTDIKDIKRKARHFYVRLGNTTGMAQHFARVAQLDACVCIIMNAITKCDLGRDNLITQLFERIKKDEARHVAVSKKHFHYLGGDEKMLLDNKYDVSHKLVDLLSTEADSFETLGIDSDLLFSKLAHARQR